MIFWFPELALEGDFLVSRASSGSLKMLKKLGINTSPPEKLTYKGNDGTVVLNHLKTVHATHIPENHTLSPVSCESLCDLCGKGFTSSDDVLKHVKNVHTPQAQIPENPALSCVQTGSIPVPESSFSPTPQPTSSSSSGLL